ncbi:hypothetical protein EDD70_2656 [Hydrogenoanaerobacterium saccharovorans]|uniref:Uncharacterized protein n=2 Tax=Hydrogenoanaerobacterium saccharovorans TaxID=474960 RepID=A0A1H8DNN3_9FIRM|nr:hypothetical protein EDD70_2656 [Hydrogenoanaerobacterium saccharovorans]SEN08951.1 hypothetical protein SAMN05216180_2717 [Hydrogenoanaerobacterium saccharovorans]
MPKNKKEEQEIIKQDSTQQINAFMNRSANHCENQNQNHNTKKESLGPNTKR